jgi:hypothetical protein
LLLVLILLLALLGAEAGARFIKPNLPPPVLGDEQELHVKRDQMVGLVERTEIDVVFVGASGVDAGILPDVFDAESESFSGAYNAAIVGMPPAFIDTWVHEVVHPILAPDLVVIGVNPQQVSVAWAEEIERVGDLENAFHTTLRDLSPGPLDRLEQRLERRSTLVEVRRQLRDPLVVVRAARDRLTGAPRSFETYEAFTVHSREHWEGLLTPLGANTQYAPAPAEALPDPAMADRMARWAASGIDVSDLRAVLGGLRDVDVVLFAPPLDYETLARSGMDASAWDEAIAEMRSEAEEAGVPFIDVRSAGFVPLDFHDKAHLDAQGAERLSRYLADAIDGLCRGGELAVC